MGRSAETWRGTSRPEIPCEQQPPGTRGSAGPGLTIPSRAKLTPRAGSGASGGTSSAGSATSCGSGQPELRLLRESGPPGAEPRLLTQLASGLPYRHRFSEDGSHAAKKASTSVVNAESMPALRAE